MSCKLCQSTNQRLFPSEVNIHFSGLENLSKPTLLAFPKLLICLDCGFVESRIERTELRRLADGSEEKENTFPGGFPRYKLRSSRVA